MRRRIGCLRLPECPDRHAQVALEAPDPRLNALVPSSTPVASRARSTYERTSGGSG
jgi:hypothetical protein